MIIPWVLSSQNPQQSNSENFEYICKAAFQDLTVTFLTGSLGAFKQPGMCPGMDCKPSEKVCKSF